MTRFMQAVSLAVGSFVLVLSPATAVELLTNGNLEAGGVLPGWTISEFLTGGGSIDSVSQEGFADRGNGQFGMFLKPFAGGDEPPGRLVNAVLEQTVPATAGVGYSFSGWSRWQPNYAGGVATLDSMSPFGAIPSPTRTEMSLAFLNAGGSVIGSAFVLDLRTQQNNFDNWVQHNFNTTFGGGSPLVAPAGTASIRVTGSMIDGAYNVDPDQSAFFDDFSLVGTNRPDQLLINGGFDMTPPEFSGFTVIEDPMDRNTVSPIGFANHTPGGSVGAWLRPWAPALPPSTVADPNDAIFIQTVAGVPNGQYKFEMWSLFETNYSGGVTTLASGSPSGAVPSPTQNLMELAFLDNNGMVLDSQTLDLRLDRIAQNGTANNGQWVRHMITRTSPAGTAQVRVTGAMIDGVFNIDPGQSAFFDDFSLDGPNSSGPTGDFNNDGLWNCADINALTAAIATGSTNLSFDMNGDGMVTLADVTDATVGWLAVGGANTPGTTSGNPYLIGDANLDGVVDGQDFIEWNTNKFMTNSAWCAGNFNGDSVVDGQDFIEWNTRKFMSSDSGSAVPEASAGLAVLCGCLLGLPVLRRRN